uniref:Uncharacterized protein n=1 Tax=Anopheles stephensi TaxID=30069 RepID=A0A182Y067_ANOST
MEPVGEGKESHPEGGGLIRADVPDEAAVRQERNPAGGTPVVDGGKDSVGPVDDTSLNARLLDKLNEQFEKQIQLLERDQLDDGFKVSNGDGSSSSSRANTRTKLNVYAEWVQSLRLLNTELVQSLREMQDTCMERMQLMRAAYLKDLERFGPDVRLKRLASVPDASANVSGEQIVALELSSNYPIVVPATDEMLVRELDAKASIIDEQRRELQELRKQTAESGSILEQLRNMTQEREKQLDDKQKEIAILQHQIVALNDQLQKAKMSTTASIDNRSLISEITDHHDKITQLRKKLKEQEDKLREANTAIQFRDEVISAQRQEIKLLNEKPPVLQQTSFTSFASARSEDDDSPTVEQRQPGGPRLLFERLGTLQQDSDAESEYVQLLKAELAELRQQLQHAHKQRSQREESEQALFRLRTVCGELLQSTGRLRGCGYRWREDCEEGGIGAGSFLHFEDDDELIEAMRDRCDALCRQLEAAAAAAAAETSSHKPNGMVEQDEGIGSASTSRLEHSDPISARDQQQVMVCIEQQLKRLVSVK